MKTLVLDLDETLVHKVECIDSFESLNSVHDLDILSSNSN